MSSKTVGIENISLRYVVLNDIVTGGIVDVTNEAAISVYFNYCQTNNTDHMFVPPTFRVQAKYDSVEHWWDLASWSPDRTAPANSELSTTAPAGSTTLTFSSVPLFWTVGEFAFLQHVIDASPYDLTKSEFVRIKSISGTNVGLFDATKITHSPISGESIYMYNRAQNWMVHLNTLSVVSLRLMIDASECNKEFAAEAHITRLDSSI